MCRALAILAFAVFLGGSHARLVFIPLDEAQENHIESTFDSDVEPVTSEILGGHAATNYFNPFEWMLTELQAIQSDSIQHLNNPRDFIMEADQETPVEENNQEKIRHIGCNRFKSAMKEYKQMLPETDIVEEVQQALDGMNQNTLTDIRDIITTLATGSSSDDGVSQEQLEEQSSVYVITTEDSPVEEQQEQRQEEDQLYAQVSDLADEDDSETMRMPGSKWIGKLHPEVDQEQEYQHAVTSALDMLRGRGSGSGSLLHSSGGSSLGGGATTIMYFEDLPMGSNNWEPEINEDPILRTVEILEEIFSHSNRDHQEDSNMATFVQEAAISSFPSKDETNSEAIEAFPALPRHSEPLMRDEILDWSWGSEPMNRDEILEWQANLSLFDEDGQPNWALLTALLLLFATAAVMAWFLQSFRELQRVMKNGRGHGDQNDMVMVPVTMQLHGRTVRGVILMPRDEEEGGINGDVSKAEAQAEWKGKGEGLFCCPPLAQHAVVDANCTSGAHDSVIVASDFLKQEKL